MPIEPAADLAVDDQHAFVSSAILGTHRVLEVGAGRGQLARRLHADGFTVTALDLSLPTKNDATGVRWIERDFLDFNDGPFDAVVFTASLHHIAPLSDALERARGLLANGGLLVVDDFDLEAPDENTARWYYETQELLAVAGVYDPGRLHDSHGHAALERWHAEHEHHDAPLHVGQAMLAEIESRFGPPQVTRGPYLYRYVCAGSSNVNVARHVMSIEARRTAEGSLRAVGLRAVVRRA